MKTAMNAKNKVMALALGLALGVVDDGWASSSAGMRMSEVDFSGGALYADVSDAGGSSAQGCATWYGAAACATFERCAAMDGVDACYEQLIR